MRRIMIKQTVSWILSLLICANVSFAQLKTSKNNLYKRVTEDATKVQNKNYLTTSEKVEVGAGLYLLGRGHKIARAITELGMKNVARNAASAAAQKAAIAGEFAGFLTVASIALFAKAGQISYERDNFSGIDQSKRPIYQGIVKARKKGYFPKFTICLVDAPYVTAETLYDLEIFLASREEEFFVEKIGREGDWRIYFSPNHNVWIDMDLERTQMKVKSSSIRSSNAPRIDHFIKP